MKYWSYKINRCIKYSINTKRQLYLSAICTIIYLKWQYTGCNYQNKPSSVPRNRSIKRIQIVSAIIFKYNVIKIVIDQQDTEIYIFRKYIACSQITSDLGQ